MEKLLNAISRRLKVRSIVEEQEVTEEVRNMFQKELKNHLFEKLQKIEVGESVVYSFNYGNAIGKHIGDANDNLAEVLLKLPALPDGNRYVLPFNTFISFALTEKNGKVDVEPGIICPWIMDEYIKQ